MRARAEILQAGKPLDNFSPLELYEKAADARKRSASIHKFFDASSVVQTDRRDKLTADLGANFESALDQVKTGAKNVWSGDVKGGGDIAVGLSKLIYNAGEAGVTHGLRFLQASQFYWARPSWRRFCALP